MTQTSMRGCAIALASMGFRVFKLGVWGRIPVVEAWPETASSDVDQVRRMWTCPIDGEGLDNNIGVLTGAAGGDLMVLDVDRKNGARGDRSLAYMVDSLELDTRTFTVKTPTGGLHLYLRTPVGQEVRNSVKAIGDGLDVRGRHGYVVGPGSETTLGVYSITLEAPIAMAPGWLVGLCGKARGRELMAHRAKIEGLDLDVQTALKRAVKYLVDEAPCAVEGCGGDATTVGVAFRLGDLGVSESMALELMLEWWNADKAFPAWLPEDLERKVRNAYQYRLRLLGVASPEAEFGDVSKEVGLKQPDPPGARSKAGRGLFYEKYDEVEAFVDDVYLVDDLLDAGALSVLYGGSGSGKTFVAMDITWCIATGTEWNGHKVRQGLVVYVSSEGGRRNRNRIIASRMRGRRRLEGEDETPFALVPCQINLLKDGGGNDAKALVALVRKVEADFGRKCEMLVIDTLARAMPGGDEHGPVDMGAFVKNVDTIRAEIDAAVMLVHHTGKDKAKGARGWSGLQAAIDTEIEINSPERNKGTMITTKQRDIDGGQSWDFELEKIEVGQRASDAKLITSCIVHWVTSAEKEFPPVTEQGEQYETRLIDLMKTEAAVEMCPIKDVWINLSDWNDYARELWVHSKHNRKSTLSAGVSDSWFKQLRQSLLLNGRVEKNEQNQWRAIGDRVGQS